MIGFGSASVQAADGTININGTVVAGACTAITQVDANGTVALPGAAGPVATLTLPTVAASTLAAAVGTYAGQTPFTIKLTGCQQAGSLNNVRAEFTSASTPVGDNHVMANTATGSAASGVGVAIMQPNGVTQIDLHNGGARDPGAALPTAAAADVILNYKAAYKSLSTTVTAGSVRGTTDFVISYF
ncbi:TPA: fimbrial protein, partial [Aeromonas veronii]